MFKLSYSTNGLTELSLKEAMYEVEKAKFEGIELSFQKHEFNPFELKKEDILNIRKLFENSSVKPVCISTATTFFLSDIAHEPSLLSLDSSKRKERINLIKRGIEIAKLIGISVVSFQSGYLREEHINNPCINPRELLISGIKECLEDIGDVILVIEPEPGMYIETLEDAVKLIKEIDNPKFRLHIDICHAYCTEKNYIQSMKKHINYTEYMHLADIKDGYNLKFMVSTLEDIKDLKLDFNFASYLINVKDDNNYIFVSSSQRIYFYKKLSELQMDNIKQCLNSDNDTTKLEFVPMKNLDNLIRMEDFDIEIKAYLDSISGTNLNVLQRAIPILKYIRNEIVSQPICNTINGKVHYHEVPGNGKIDFTKVFKMLNDSYDKYITVELYNHSSIWKTVLYDSRKYLLNCINK